MNQAFKDHIISLNTKYPVSILRVPWARFVGLILSYGKVDNLHGVKYEILLPDKKQRGIEGLEKSIEGPEILPK